ATCSASSPRSSTGSHRTPRVSTPGVRQEPEPGGRRLPAMLTTRRLAAPAALLAIVATLAACGGGAQAPGPSPTPEPTPTNGPRPGGVGGGNDGSGGGGIGVVPPGGIVDPGNGGNPILGRAKFVSPVAGLINQHPVSVQLLRATAD